MTITKRQLVEAYQDALPWAAQTLDWDHDRVTAELEQLEAEVQRAQDAYDQAVKHRPHYTNRPTTSEKNAWAYMQQELKRVNWLRLQARVKDAKTALGRYADPKAPMIKQLS